MAYDSPSQNGWQLLEGASIISSANVHGPRSRSMASAHQIPSYRTASLLSPPRFFTYTQQTRGTVLIYASVIWLRNSSGFAFYAGSIAVTAEGWSEEKACVRSASFGKDWDICLGKKPRSMDCAGMRSIEESSLLFTTVILALSWRLLS